MAGPAPMRTISAGALAAVSGVSYGFALAPGGHPAVAWIALVPLLAACGRSPPATASLCGLVFAVTATGFVADWFPGMLQRFFGSSVGGAWLGWLGLALLVDAPPYMALCGWIGWRGRIGAASPLLVGAGWLVAEWLRAHGPVPNPYALLATTQLGTPLAQSADAIGAFGVGAAVAAGNAALAAVVTPALRSSRPVRDFALAFGGVAVLFAYGAWRAALPYGEGRPVRVALIQPAVVPGQDPGANARALQQLLTLTDTARRDDTRLVFWPESAVDFYLREAGSDRDRVLAATRAADTELVLGGPHYRYAEPSADTFASVFLLRGGRVAGRYDKHRLVPFAEYGPFGGWLRAPTAQLRPGERMRPLEATGASIGAFLCGEVLFPEVARALSRAGATILANPSNDAWFGAEAPARHQLRAAAFRAIENRRPLVRATTTGYSAILDAHGEAIAVSTLDAPALLEARVQPSNATTPYQRGGFALAPCAGGLLAAASVPRRRHRHLGGTRP